MVTRPLEEEAQPYVRMWPGQDGWVNGENQDVARDLHTNSRHRGAKSFDADLQREGVFFRRQVNHEWLFEVL
jgi:hypothetical protein